MQIKDPETREQIKKIFTMENATPTEKYKFRKQMAIRKYQRNIMDFGSPGVQVAMMTERVFHLVEEFKKKKKRDIKLFRTVQSILDKRSRLLEYLRKTDYNRFMQIVRDYGINADPKELKTWKAHKDDLPRFSNGKGSKFSV